MLIHRLFIVSSAVARELDFSPLDRVLLFSTDSLITRLSCWCSSTLAWRRGNKSSKSVFNDLEISHSVFFTQEEREMGTKIKSVAHSVAASLFMTVTLL